MHILHEGAARELDDVVSDDPGRDPETAHQSFQELNRWLSSHLSPGPYFRSLCKLVDSNEQEFKAPSSTGEGAQDVEPPDRGGPSFGELEHADGYSWGGTGRLHIW